MTLYLTGPELTLPSSDFSFGAHTTSINALRVMRALQLPRPILLEGSPGGGKTSLVAAIAKSARYNLVRINLSEQTVGVTCICVSITVFDVWSTCYRFIAVLSPWLKVHQTGRMLFLLRRLIRKKKKFHCQDNEHSLCENSLSIFLYLICFSYCLIIIYHFNHVLG